MESVIVYDMRTYFQTVKIWNLWHCYTLIH